MLSIRLKAIAQMIPKSASRVIDVGCDHALLDIYLAKKYTNMKFLATDVNENALSAAIKNIETNNLQERIDTKLTDGLNGIELKKGDYIVISGMGTKTIISILEKYASKVNNIIVQSNRDLERLRSFMYKHNFYIKTEEIVLDKKYYVVIYFQKIKFACFKVKPKMLPEDYWLGPFVKKSDNKAYFLYLLQYYEELLKTLPVFEKKAIEFEKRINYLKNLIEKK